jgi:hypothetical protein
MQIDRGIAVSGNELELAADPERVGDGADVEHAVFVRRSTVRDRGQTDQPLA